MSNIYDHIGELEQMNALDRIGQSMDGDPKRAARSIQMGQASQEEPEVIYHDFENKEKELKANMAYDIVSDNPYLKEYVNRDPMAAKVSADDWGALDNHSRELQKLPKGDDPSMLGSAARGALRSTLPSIGSLPAIGYGATVGGALGGPVGAIAGGLVAGLAGGYTLSLIQDWVLDQLPESFVEALGMDKETLSRDLATNPTAHFTGGLMPNLLTMKLRLPGDKVDPSASIAARVLGSPAGQRVVSGAAQGGVEAGQELFTEEEIHWGHVALATAFGAAWATPNRLGAPLIRSGERLGDGFITRIEPYLKAGQQPPLGIDPLVDIIKGARVEEDIKNLDAAMAGRAGVGTFEISPETYGVFAGAHTDGNLRISVNAIRALYPDKPPMPGDGILGWVPDLAKRLDGARGDGKITVPIKDWLQNADDAVYKTLREDIAIRTEGATIREMGEYNKWKVAAEQRAAIDVYHGSPHVFDAWSMEKIGTGEGAASYGHGAYFAENRAVAEQYKPKDIGFNTATLGEPVDKPAGALYRARINADKEQFLDWDKPLREQHPEVQQKLKALDIEHGPFEQGAPGERVYRLLQERAGRVEPGSAGAGIGLGKAAASEALHAAGIPGIKYLDQGSRKSTFEISETSHPTEGKLFTVYGDPQHSYFKTREEAQARIDQLEPKTHNFVVFDEKLIEVTHRNDQVVTSVRKSAALDPPPPELPPTGYSLERVQQILPDQHLFHINDPKGELVGEVIVGVERDGKLLHIDNIGTPEGANSLGFTAVKDLLKQLHDQFPEAEGYSGLKVGGARKDGEAKQVEFKFTQTEGVEQALNKPAVRGVDWDMGGTKVRLVATEEMTRHERQVTRRISELIRRLVGKDVVIAYVDAFETGDGRRTEGMFTTFEAQAPVIALALGELGALPRVARHEALHFLREYGLIKPAEWAALVKEAKAQGWIESHRIKERYPEIGDDPAMIMEEAIAHEFGWALGEGAVTDVELAKHMTTHGEVIGGIIARVKEFLSGVRQILAESFGYTPKVADIFNMIERGEAGERAPGKSRHGGMRLSVAPEEEPLFMGRGKLGLSAATYDKVTELVDKQRSDDRKASIDAVYKDIKKRQTKAWKDAEAVVRDEVQAEIDTRPDIVADVILGEASKRRGPGRLNAAMLTPEQKAALPASYYGNNGTMSPDNLAASTGFSSGNDAIAAVVELYKARGKLNAGNYKQHLVDTEVEQRMFTKYGDLDENILKEVKDQVFSDTQLELLHEKLLLLGEEAGWKGTPIKMDEIKKAIHDQVAKSQVKDINLEDVIAQVGRFGRVTQESLIKQDYVETLKNLEQQYLSAVTAREVMRLQKTADSHAKLVERYSEAEVGVTAPEWSNQIQALLQAAGEHDTRSATSIAESRARVDAPTLIEFQARWVADYPDLKFPDWIMAENIKLLPDMTVAEFEQWAAAIKLMDRYGRMQQKVLVGQTRMTQEQLKADVKANLETLPVMTKEQQEKWYNAWRFKGDAWLGRAEEWLKDMDLRKDLGPLFNVFVRPLMEGKHKSYTLMDKVTTHIKAVQDKMGSAYTNTLSTSVTNNFLKNETGQLFDMSKLDLIGIMFNWGNESNKIKFINGYRGKTDAEAFRNKIQDMIDKNATADDWTFVRDTAKIFDILKPEAADLYFRETGNEPEWLDLKPGEFYWPIFIDDWGAKVHPTKGSAFDKNYYAATTWNHYMSLRTGSIDRVDFRNSLDKLGGRVQQVIHDISYREAIQNANKVLNNTEIMSLMKNHFGVAYSEALRPWIHDIANRYNQDEVAHKFLYKGLRELRMNLAVAALGFDLKLMLTPEVGTFNLRAIAETVLNRSEYVRLAHEHSKEIPHMMRQVGQDYNDIIDVMIDKKGWSGVRADIARMAFYPVAKISQGFRIVTFVDAFNEARKTMSDADAAVVADSTLRQRHGASGLPDLSAAMRGPEPQRLITLFYGFANNMYNWQRQIPGAMKRGEYMEAVTAAWGSIAVPAILGFGFYNEYGAEDGPLTIIGKSIGGQVASTMPIVREGVSFFLEGKTPSSPVFSIFRTAAQIYADVSKIDWDEPELPKDFVKHTMTMMGLGLGVPGMATGRAGQYLKDVHDGNEQPQNVLEFARGIIYGTTKQKPKKWRWWDEIME